MATAKIKRKPEVRANPNAILTAEDERRIALEAERARAESRKVINVPGYKRRLYRLPKQMRMDRAFRSITTLLNIADAQGVTARDVAHCELAIRKMREKFLSSGR